MSCDTATLRAYRAVQAALADVRAEHSVHIPLAVESGSRAWGFPSSDSDYDARFVYVRTAARRLTPWPARPYARSSPRMRGPRLLSPRPMTPSSVLKTSLGPRMCGDERSGLGGGRQAASAGEARAAAAALYRATVERLDVGVDR